MCTPGQLFCFRSEHRRSRLSRVARTIAAVKDGIWHGGTSRAACVLSLWRLARLRWPAAFECVRAHSPAASGQQRDVRSTIRSGFCWLLDKGTQTRPPRSRSICRPCSDGASTRSSMLMSDRSCSTCTEAIRGRDTGCSDGWVAMTVKQGNSRSCGSSYGSP